MLLLLIHTNLSTMATTTTSMATAIQPMIAPTIVEMFEVLESSATTIREG